MDTRKSRKRLGRNPFRSKTTLGQGTRKFEFGEPVILQTGDDKQLDRFAGRVGIVIGSDRRLRSSKPIVALSPRRHLVVPSGKLGRFERSLKPMQRDLQSRVFAKKLPVFKGKR